MGTLVKGGFRDERDIEFNSIHRGHSDAHHANKFPSTSAEIFAAFDCPDELAEWLRTPTATGGLKGRELGKQLGLTQLFLFEDGPVL